MMFAQVFLALHTRLGRVDRGALVNPGRRIFGGLIGYLVGGRTTEYDEAIESRALCLGPLLDPRQGGGGKAPDEIGPRGNVWPGRGLFQIKLYASVRRYMGEVLDRLTACREEGARYCGQLVGNVSAGIADAKNDDRTRHTEGNGWMPICCGINSTTYGQFFQMQLL